MASDVVFAAKNPHLWYTFFVDFFYIRYMGAIFYSILPIFILMGVGVVIKLTQNIQHPVWARMCSTFGFCDDRWSEVLNKYALYVALPALLIHSLTHTDKIRLMSRGMLLTNISLLVALLTVLFLVTKIFKIKKELANTYIICGFFGNVAYLGVPFILSLFPNAGGDVSVLVALHVVIAFTLGLYILEHSRHKTIHLETLLRNILMNPLLLASALGLFILYMRVPVPRIIDTALGMLAASSSPTVLIAMGLFLARRIRFDMSLFHALCISGIKLILMPVVFILAAAVLKFENNFETSILQAGMPVALSVFALAEIYPLDKKIAAKAIILSTILSLFTLTGLANIVL